MAETPPIPQENAEILRPVIEMLGVQARLVHKDQQYLDPSKDVTSFDPVADVAAFEHRKYATFQNVSDYDRTAYWAAQRTQPTEGGAEPPRALTNAEQQARWSQDVVRVFAAPTRKETVTKLAPILSKIGIPADTTFSDTQATQIYDRYFKNQPTANPDQPRGVKKFVDDVVQAYTQDGIVDQAKIKQDLPALQWFARIFGETSNQMLVQLIDAEVKLKIQPAEFGEAIKMPIKKDYLDQHPEEKQLLEFISHHKDFQLPVQPTESAATNERTSTANKEITLDNIENRKMVEKFLKRKLIDKSPGEFSNSLFIAETGAGKSTRIGGLIDNVMKAGNFGDKYTVMMGLPNINLVEETAGGVAHFMNGKVGKEVGWKHGYDENVSRVAGQEKFRLVTNGILLNTLLDRNKIKQYKDTGKKFVVIFDEGHKLDAYQVLAKFEVEQLMKEFPDTIYQITMTATAEKKRFMDHDNLSEPQDVLEIKGSAYDITPEFAAAGKRKDITQITADQLKGDNLALLGITMDQIVQDSVDRIANIVANHSRDQGANQPAFRNILNFLPGKREMRKVEELIDRPITGLRARGLVPANLKIIRLHSGSSDEEWEMVKNASQSTEPILILATDVVKQGRTINNVTDVIVSGIGRESVYDPHLGFDQLKARLLSDADITQMFGRTGRDNPGRSHSLYFTEEDYTYLKDIKPFPTPQTELADLTDVVLKLKLMQEAGKITDLGSARLLTKLPAETIARGIKNLKLLGALDVDEKVTPLGKEMDKIPLGYQQSRAIIESKDARNNAFEEVVSIAAMTQSIGKGLYVDLDDIADAEKAQVIENRKRFYQGVVGSDFIVLLNIERAWQQQYLSIRIPATLPPEQKAPLERQRKQKLQQWCKAHGLKYKAMDDMHKLRRKILALARVPENTVGRRDPTVQADKQLIERCINIGYQDRLMMLNATTNEYVVLEQNIDAASARSIAPLNGVTVKVQNSPRMDIPSTVGPSRENPMSLPKYIVAGNVSVPEIVDPRSGQRRGGVTLVQEVQTGTFAFAN